MIIVGELLNASRKSIATAIEAHDVETIQEVAQKQVRAGAHYIDVNAGTFQEKEPEYLSWMVKTVQEAVDVPCCLDSPNPKALEAALNVHRGVPMINSISMEHERREALLPLLAGARIQVVALCMGDAGMPRTAHDRVLAAESLIELLARNNIRIEDMYVDPLVQPVSTDSSSGHAFLDAVQEIVTRCPGIHTMCGLSNVSYGLPLRKALNRTFMAMAISRGLDGAILDPLDDAMMAEILSAEALVGRDPFCMNFIKAYRRNQP